MINGNNPNGGHSYSDKFDFQVSDIENAMTCLINMQKYEDTPNYGQLTYNSTIKSRYDINAYVDKIDSLHYTDLATSTLSYTIYFLKNNCNVEFSQDIYDKSIIYAGDLIENNENIEFVGFDEIMQLNNTNASSSIELYNYLKANYDVVEERVANNGDIYYYVEARNSVNTVNKYYFSADFLNGDIDVYGYYPGTGGPYNDYKEVGYSIEETGVPANSVIALSGNYLDSKMDLFSVIDRAKENFDFNIQSVNLVTFSGSGGTGFNVLDTYLKQNPEIKESSMIVCDGYIMENIIDNPGNWENSEIIKRGTNVYMVEPTHPYGREYARYNVPEMTEVLKNIGFNVSYVKETSGTRHDANFTNKLIVDGLDFYLFGKTNELTNAGDYGFTNDAMKYKKGEIELESIDNIPRAGFVSNQNYDVATHSFVSADGIRYRVDVIGDITDETPVILLNHGGESSDATTGDYMYYNSWLANEETRNVNAVVITYNRGSTNANDNAYRLMEEVSEKFEIPIENCSTAGFSLGGEQAMKQMADLVMAHPEIKNPNIMFIDAYLTGGGNALGTEELQALGDSGAVVLNVRQNGIVADIEIYEKWSNEYGIKFIKIDDNHCYVSSAQSSHHGVFNDYFELGLFKYQMGQGAFPSGTCRRNGQEVNNFVDMEYYDAESDSWITFNITGKTLKETYELLKLDFNNINGPIELPDPILGTIYNQHDYSHIPYYVRGDGSVANIGDSGCGFFSALSAITAKTGHIFSEDEIEFLVENVAGGQNGLGHDGRMELVLDYLGEEYGFTWEKATYDPNLLMSELENGNAVIALMPSGDSNSGHFIPFTGILDNGNVVINDTSTLLDRNCVENIGFTPGQVDNIVTRGNAWYIDFGDYYNSGEYEKPEIDNIPEEPPVVEEKPPVVEQKPPVVEEKTPVIEERPPVIEEKPPVVEEKPPVVEEKPPVVEEKPPVVEERPPVVEEKPPVVEERPPVVEERPPIVEEKPPVVEEKPPVVEEEPPVVEEELNNKPNSGSNIGSSSSSSNSGDAKKYIIPGIIGTGLALLSAKINNFIKKKKKNNDV